MARYALEDMLFHNAIRLDWVREGNFGDILNPVLASLITERKILHVNPAYYVKPYVSAIGSICDRARANAVIWGSGFISANSVMQRIPLDIRSVRGPKTGEKYNRCEVEVPKIYGDPALLLRKFYRPTIEKKYRLGLIPHYVDAGFFRKYWRDPRIKVISPICTNPLDVVNQILECECILSTSLHGLIVSESYGLKTKWIKASDKLIGGNFKFLDHYESIGLDGESPIWVKDGDDCFDLEKDCFKKRIDLDLDKLLSVSPFL